MMSAPVPRITQPWMVRYERWLEENDDVLAALATDFLYQLPSTHDRSATLEQLLRMAYRTSSSARRVPRAQRDDPSSADTGLGRFAPLTTGFICNAHFLS
jgi:hypothetical protein